MRVEVAYVGPEGQFLAAVELRDGSTAGDAVRESGLLAKWPALVVDDAHVGIWSRICGLDSPVRDGDRVEIYRPLAADPKEIRRRRAKEQSRK